MDGHLDKTVATIQYAQYARDDEKIQYNTHEYTIRQKYNKIQTYTTKIQYARDDEIPHFCINLNKNIDSEVYCNANEFPNHLLY
jgi:hypothetical protein